MTALASLTADQLAERITWGNDPGQRRDELTELVGRLKTAGAALDAAEQRGLTGATTNATAQARRAEKAEARAVQAEQERDEAQRIARMEMVLTEAAEARATKATNALREIAQWDYQGFHPSTGDEEGMSEVARAVLADLAAEEAK